MEYEAVPCSIEWETRLATVTPDKLAGVLVGLLADFSFRTG